MLLAFDRAGAALASGARGGRRDAAAALHRRAPRRRRRATASDYQTVFAARPGAVAAPTAALHFDEALLADLAARGVGQARLTLHVGAGTFLPVKVEDIADAPDARRMGRDRRRRPPRRSRDARRRRPGDPGRHHRAAPARDRRDRPGRASRPGRGETDIFIRPGYALPRRRRADDQLPPAEVDAADAGLGADGRRAHPRDLRPRHRRAATASSPTATRRCCCRRSVHARVDEPERQLADVRRPRVGPPSPTPSMLAVSAPGMQAATAFAISVKAGSVFAPVMIRSAPAACRAPRRSSPGGSRRVPFSRRRWGRCRAASPGPPAAPGAKPPSPRPIAASTAAAQLPSRRRPPPDGGAGRSPRARQKASPQRPPPACRRAAPARRARRARRDAPAPAPPPRRRSTIAPAIGPADEVGRRVQPP